MTFITSPCEIAQNARERASYVILIELLDTHDRSVILSREPTAAFALFGTAEIAGVDVPRPSMHGEQVDNILQQFADSLRRDGLLFCLDTKSRDKC